MSRLPLKADPVEIDPDRAVAIGIVVNELVMNAVKYAYPDGAGPIHVTLDASGDDVELAIIDDGVGLNVKTDPRSTGMGQRIVSAMAQKLEAEVERRVALRVHGVLVQRDGEFDQKVGELARKGGRSGCGHASRFPITPAVVGWPRFGGGGGSGMLSGRGVQSPARRRVIGSSRSPPATVSWSPRSLMV